MADTLYYPNLKKDGERPIATGTKVTVGPEDKACLDVFIQNTSLAPVNTGPIQFTKDAATVTVTEDTVTPSNNIPLPVKLSSVTGDINITAGDLNVQLSHAGASFDSTRIGDGTDLLAITAAGEATVSLTTALPAGTNNIGDVDVVSIIPGTGATNLGKAEDSIHASGDVGVMALAVRSDAGTLLAADGDYIPLSVNASGELRVTSAASSEAATAADGAAAPAVVKVIAGVDGVGNTQQIAVDTSGELQIDVLSSALPSGAATSANQTNGNQITKITDGTDTLLITGSGEALVSLTTALPAGTNNIGDVDVLSQPARSHTTDSIKVGDGTDFLAISGTGEASVAVTSALPAGNNNIGDVDIASIVPGSGATNLGKAEDAAHASGDVGVMALAVRNDAGTLLAADGDYIPLSINSSGELRVTTAAAANVDIVDFLDTPLLDASSTNIPGSGSTPLTVVASLAASVKKIQVLDTTGAFFGIFSDPAGTPVLQMIVGPGSDTVVECAIASGQVIGLRSLTTSAVTVGNVAINFIG